MKGLMRNVLDRSRNFDAHSLLAGAVLGGTLGGAASASFAYILARRSASREFEARLNDELIGIRKHYRIRAANLHGGRDSGSGGPDSESDSGQYNVVGTARADEADALGDDGAGSFNGSEHLTSDPDGANTLVPDGPDWPPANRDTSQPYVISPIEFANIDPAWQQATLTYYTGDRTLADDKEQPIRDVKRTVGPLSIKGFGGISRDPSIRYVRNEQLEMDFEIILDRRSFADAVLNYGDPNRVQNDSD